VPERASDRFFGIMLLVVLSACFRTPRGDRDADGGPEEDLGTFDCVLAVLPDRPLTITAGTGPRLAAWCDYAEGSRQDVTEEAVWTSSSPAVAEVSNAPGTKGRLMGLAAGTTGITAQLDSSMSNTVSVNVVFLEPIRISVSPMVVLPPEASVSMTAMVEYEDGSSFDVTELVETTWAVSDGEVGTVSNEPGSKGVVSSVSPGIAEISASIDVFQGTAAMTVLNGDPIFLRVEPRDYRVPLGSTLVFLGLFQLSDEGIRAINEWVIWASSDESVATVSNEIHTEGVAEALAAGTTTISGDTYLLSDATTLTVTAESISSIGVEAEISSDLVVGTTRQFTSSCTYTDDVVSDCTHLVVWQSSDPTVTSMAADDERRGVAMGLAPGTAGITASYGAVTSPPAALTVVAAEAVDLWVKQVDPAIQLGTTLPLRAIQSWTDGAQIDVSAFCTWSSSDPVVAVVDNAPGAEGFATGVSEGATTITASLPPFEASTTLTVGTP